MKALVQRVKEASVDFEGKIIARIGQGMLVLVGLTHSDTEKEAEELARKLVALRIFSDGIKPINASVDQIEGEILLVSQFTLYGNTKKGNRPSFVDAMEPGKAEVLFDFFCKKVESLYSKVKKGQFGADCQVSLVNDGPTTIMLEMGLQK